MNSDMFAKAAGVLMNTVAKAGAKEAAEEAVKGATKNLFLESLKKNTLDSLIPNLAFSSIFPVANVMMDPSILQSEEGRSALLKDLGISVASAGIGASVGGLGQTVAARFAPGKYVTGIKPEVTQTFDDLNKITGKAKVAPVNFDSSKRDIGIAYRDAYSKLSPSDAQKIDALLPDVNRYVHDYINDGKQLFGRTHVPSQIPIRVGQIGDAVGSIASSMGLYGLAYSQPQADPTQFEKLLNQGQYEQPEITAQQLMDRYGTDDQFVRAPGTMSQVSNAQVDFEDLLRAATATPYLDDAYGVYA